MSKKRRPKYCWDSSVFLAWMKEEAGAPLDDIGLVADSIDDDRADLIVPVTVFSEIIEAKHTKSQLHRMQQFCKRSNVLSVDTTRAIAERAGELRSALLKEGRKLKTPDAQITATAILYGADALHTLDPDLLKISKSAAVAGLVIIKPRLMTGHRAIPGFGAVHDDDMADLDEE